MEDETVLDLTRKKLKLFKGQFLKRQSLERCAVRLIEKNIGFYLNAQDEEQQLQSLPGALRDKILQELLKRKCREENGNGAEFELLTKAFNLFLSPRTTSIELNGILSFCPDRYKDESIREVTPHCVQMLEEISKLATNLKELTLKSNHAFQTHILPERMEPQMLGALIKMQNLNRLFVEPYSFEVQEILDVCKNLPNLQYVNVRLEHLEESQYPSNEILKESLSNLKEFIFESKDQRSESKNHNWLRLMCIENLPNLEIVHFYSDVNDVLEDRGGGGSIACPAGRTPKLRHLFIDYYGYLTHDSFTLSFPNVTHLKIDAWITKRNDDQLFEFGKLKCLNLCSFKFCDQLIFERLCTTYGNSLHTLCISNEEVCDFDLETVVTHCEALEKLALQNIYIWPHEIPNSCQLKELEWKFTNVEAYPDLQDAPMMLLSRILSAPLLEKVELVGVRFDLDDLKEVFAMIERRQILQNLHTFNFHFYWISEHAGDVKIFKAVANVVKSASALLPQLKNIKFASTFSGEYCSRPGCFSLGDDYDYKYYFDDPFLTYEKMRQDQRLKDDCILEILELYK